MCPALPPPPPAVVKPVPSAKPARNAENFGGKQLTQAEIRRGVHFRKGPWGNHSHANNIQIKHKHTNRLHSRKQAKLRAKRKSR